MAVKIQIRNGISTEWTSANPVLAIGELAIESDTRRFKIGDGITAWSLLSYSNDRVLPSLLKTVSYTLALTDEAGVQKCLSASAIDATIPLNATVSFAVGTTVEFLQYGAGVLTIIPISGVTLNGGTVGIPLTGQYKMATLYCVAVNEWIIVGAI